MAKAKKQEEIGYVIESFARSVTPLPVESAAFGNGNVVYWGDNNLYPNFLLELYHTVPLHQSIINSKVDYIIGDGLVEKATGKPYEYQVSIKDSASKLAYKCVFDFVISNIIAVYVEYNAFGKAIYVDHIPFNHMRTNETKTKFWVCNDWFMRPQTQLSYQVYKPGSNPDKDTRVFVYTPYVPSAQNTYPAIRYGSGITNMVNEKVINDFCKNDLEDGFSAAHVISFFKGMPDSVEGKKFSEKVKAAYSGAKGAKYIIDFNMQPTQQTPAAPINVATIDSPDYSAKLSFMNTKNESNILAAHQAPSRALFGIEQAAGLNGNDLENAYAIFNNTWVKVNRNNAEEALNILFKDLGFPESEFKAKGSLLPKNLSDTTKEKVYTVNELRALDGLPPKADGTGDVLLEQPKQVVAGQAFSLMPPVTQSKGRILTEEDFLQVQHLGIPKEQYTVLDESIYPSTPEDFRAIQLQFDDASDIEDWILNNEVDGMTDSQIRAAIRKELGISATTAEIKEKVSKLKEAGIIGDQPEKKSLTRDVKIMYEYKVRPGFGSALLSTSRGFCKKLIGNDRLYTREDIQAMSAIFGYDVFKHCGGWYYNPKTDQAENQCRHEWKTVRALKKTD